MGKLAAYLLGFVRFDRRRAAVVAIGLGGLLRRHPRMLPLAILGWAVAGQAVAIFAAMASWRTDYRSGPDPMGTQIANMLAWSPMPAWFTSGTFVAAALAAVGLLAAVIRGAVRGHPPGLDEEHAELVDRRPIAAADPAG